MRRDGWGGAALLGLWVAACGGGAPTGPGTGPGSGSSGGLAPAGGTGGLSVPGSSSTGGSTGGRVPDGASSGGSTTGGSTGTGGTTGGASASGGGGSTTGGASGGGSTGGTSSGGGSSTGGASGGGSTGGSGSSGGSTSGGSSGCAGSLEFCGGACVDVQTDASDCGACGKVCPGLGQTTCDVACAAASCALTCQGENYDVNGNPADGCEVADSPQGNHVQTSAFAETASPDCTDSDSHFVWSGIIPSDRRVHANPSVNGFDNSSGSAPDWFSRLANGPSGLFSPCVEDVLATLVVSGSVQPDCYQLTVITDENQWTAQTDTSGTATVQDTSAVYTDGSVVYYEVSKTCSVVETHTVAYSLSGHL